MGYNSANSTIANNIIENINNHGISISSAKCRVENNTISGCGIQMAACYTTTTVSIADLAAIRIYSDDCYVVNNIVINNINFGIRITGKRNIIYGNTIAGNALGNGYSNGEDNQWDNGIDTGNNWGDWNLIGVYFVSGEEGCIDRYPNGYVNNSTVIGISFSTVLILSSIVGCVTIVILVIIKSNRNKIQTTQ